MLSFSRQLQQYGLSQPQASPQVQSSPHDFVSHGLLHGERSVHFLALSSVLSLAGAAVSGAAAAGSSAFGVAVLSVIVTGPLSENGVFGASSLTNA